LDIAQGYLAGKPATAMEFGSPAPGRLAARTAAATARVAAAVTQVRPAAPASSLAESYFFFAFFFAASFFACSFDLPATVFG
jgi:hypothetical protein